MRAVLKFACRKPLGAVGAVLVVVLTLAAIAAPLAAPEDPNKLHYDARLVGPSTSFWMGTDDYGRDLFSRIIWGARLSLYIGFLAVALGTTSGSLLGLVSAYAGGIFDLLVQRVVDALQAMPGLLIALVIVSVFSPSANILVVAIAVPMIASPTRVIRSQALSVKEMTYIEAARTIGCSPVRILFRHVLPQCIAPYLILGSIGIGHAILTEASVSFLGAGVPPPAASWGRMVTGAARQFGEIAPWLVIFPGIAISMAVFGFNLFGDALRDVLDPRLRGGR